MIFNGSFVSFLISHQFSILFNGNFTFSLFSDQFSMSFNRKFAFCQFSILFNWSWSWSGGLKASGGGGMDGRMEIHPIDRPMDGWTEQATKNLVMSALDGAFHQATERYSQRLMMK